MNIRELTEMIAAKLQNDDALFEARQTVMHLFGLSTGGLILHKNDEVDDDTLARAKKIIDRRNSGEPLYYILGQTEFYSLPFYVGHGVLIPRQDTETLIDKAIEIIGKYFDKPVKAADICSGSGCIGITLAKNIPNITVDCVELYDDAIQYLEKNISLNNCENVSMIKANALTFCGDYDIVLSNPPYIRHDEKDTLSKEVLSEPHTALFADDDGLLFYKKITENFENRTGIIIYEIGETQGSDVSDILIRHGFDRTEIIKDDNRLDRVVVGINSKKINLYKEQ